MATADYSAYCAVEEQEYQRWSKVYAWHSKNSKKVPRSVKKAFSKAKNALNKCRKHQEDVIKQQEKQEERTARVEAGGGAAAAAASLAEGFGISGLFGGDDAPAAGAAPGAAAMGIDPTLLIAGAAGIGLLAVAYLATQ